MIFLFKIKNTNTNKEITMKDEMNQIRKITGMRLNKQSREVE